MWSVKKACRRRKREQIRVNVGVDLKAGPVSVARLRHSRNIASLLVSSKLLGSEYLETA